MKQITNKTILKQGDKTYQPVEVDGVIYWADENTQINKGDFYYSAVENCIERDFSGVKEDNSVEQYELSKIVAQSQLHLEGIPVISLDIDDIITRLNTTERYDSVNKRYNYSEQDLIRIYTLNQYTQKDIENVIELAQTTDEQMNYPSINDILDQINFISVVEVDVDFNIISYE